MGLRRSTTDDHHGDVRTSRFAMPRTRGAASGVLLILLGLWGGLVPFVGPYFDWTIGSDRAWDFTAGRFWLSILPAAATLFGGLLLLRSANRATATFGAWSALAGGAWFVIGPVMSMLWNDGQPQTGQPLGGATRQALEWLTYHYGLGVLIAAIAGIALGRVWARLARDVERLEPATRADTDGRFTTRGQDAQPAGITRNDIDGDGVTDTPMRGRIRDGTTRS